MPQATSRQIVTQADIDEQASALIDGLPDGEPIDEVTEAIIAMSIRASAMALDVDGTREYLARALQLGATAPQLQEAITLVSGTGVHTFFESTRSLDALVADEEPAELDPERQRLWEKYVGDGGYWNTMQEEIPGFLAALNRMSPEAFEAFFVYCAVPWKSRNLPVVVKELISVAIDSNPSHRYLPGMRMHIRNAVKMGAGRLALRATLAIAAAGPAPQGVL